MVNKGPAVCEFLKCVYTGFHDELKRELCIMQMLVQKDSIANTRHTETSDLILSCSLHPDLLYRGLAMSQIYGDSVWLISLSVMLGFELQLPLRMGRF